jgi:hypothetical protein
MLLDPHPSQFLSLRETRRKVNRRSMQTVIVRAVSSGANQLADALFSVLKFAIAPNDVF